MHETQQSQLSILWINQMWNIRLYTIPTTMHDAQQDRHAWYARTKDVDDTYCIRQSQPCNRHSNEGYSAAIVSMTCKSHCHVWHAVVIAMHHLYSTVTACVICISHCYAWDKMRHSDRQAWYEPAKVMHNMRQPRSCLICYDTDMHCMHRHSHAWCATATAIHDTQQLQSCVTCKSQPCLAL